MNSLIIFVAQYLIFIIGVCFVLYGAFRVPKGEQKTFLFTKVCALVIGLVLAEIAGTLYFSPRPFVLDNTVPLFPHIASNGFPSNHTVIACLLALLLWRYNRKVSVVLLVLAVMVGLARVIANVHHVQDIVAGVLVAGIAVAVTHLLVASTLAHKRRLQERE